MKSQIRIEFANITQEMLLNLRQSLFVYFFSTENTKEAAEEYQCNSKPFKGV